MKALDGPTLWSAFKAGTAEVCRQRQLLDRINVFPVPDGDTGHNLAETLKSAARLLPSEPPRAAGEVAGRLAEGALYGARGNSGVIFAQFLAGFASALRGVEHLATDDFVRAGSRGAEFAYRAVANPQKGTILTVLRSWAEALEHASRADDSPVEPGQVLARSLPATRAALLKTTEQLEVLRQARVVDAGALGLVYFLEGMSTGLNGHPVVERTAVELPLQDAPAPLHEATAPGAHRFCTEALLAGDSLDGESLRKTLGQMGDSLVMAGDQRRLLVHLHTDTPRLLFEKVAGLGRVLRCKIEDMWLQQASNARRPVALVTDSTCDLPERTQNNYRVVQVPLSISFAEKSFRDGVDIAPAVFYQLLRDDENFPKTSQPAVGNFVDLYRRLLEKHQYIVSVHIAEALSGTVSAARLAAEKVAPERIAVIDSCQVSVGLGLVVESLGRALEQGAGFEQLQVLARRVAESTRVFGCPASLQHGVRGGRVGARTARWLDRTGFTPLIAFDRSGRARVAGARFGFDRALSALARRARRFCQGARGPVRAQVVHADAVESGLQLVELLKRHLEIEQVPVLQAGAVLGTHVGPGAVALAVCRE